MALGMGTVASPSRAEPTTPEVAGPGEESLVSLEVSGALGPSLVFGATANPEYSPSLTRVGLFGEIGVAFRSHYFIDPTLGVGYALLASGEAQLGEGPWGTGGKLEQDLRAWTITPGISTEIWRFQPRLGLGIIIVQQTNTFLGRDNSVTQSAFASQFGLAFHILRDGPVRMDAEARLVLGSGVDITFVGLGVVARGNVVSW